MGLVTLTAHVAGTVLTAAALNNNFNAIVNQVNGSIEAVNIAALAVTTAKIATGAVTGPKIAMGSDAQGDILYHNGTSYVRLAAGTSGQYLKTLGSGANPAWAGGASGADVLAGTEASKFVVPSTMISHQGVVKGWIEFNGTGTIATTDSFNVSGIVDNGTGDYTVTWDTDFASANYAVVCSHIDDNGTTPTYGQIAYYNKLAGSVDIKTGDNSGSFVDVASVSVIAIGDR